jgi:hypothetical protein
MRPLSILKECFVCLFGHSATLMQVRYNNAFTRMPFSASSRAAHLVS